MPAELEELYDDATLGRLARHGPRREQAAESGNWRMRTAAGVVATSLALGLREVFDPPADDPIVEEVDMTGGHDGLPVTVVLVPGAPALSWATVHPWRMRLRG